MKIEKTQEGAVITLSYNDAKAILNLTEFKTTMAADGSISADHEQVQQATANSREFLRELAKAALLPKVEATPIVDLYNQLKY
jgi:hypothetical protein